MQDDFFDDVEEKQLKSERESIPTPSVYGNKPYKRPKAIRWWHILSAVGIGVFAFIFGYVTSYASVDPELRMLLKIKNNIQTYYYEDISDEEFYSTLYASINNELLDDYSEYMTAEELMTMVEDLEGSRIGIGVTFSGTNDKPLQIMRVCGNSPAEEAGLRVGDEILGCGKTAEEIQACSTFEEFSALIAGYGENEEFYLTVRFEGADRTIAVHKSAYVENYVFYRTKDTAYAFDVENDSAMIERGIPFAWLAEDTAYIQIVQFTGNSAVAFDKSMEKFKEDGKKNLVLDLRGNGGGYLDSMQSIAKYFCKDSEQRLPIAAIADYGERTEIFLSKGNCYYDYFAEDSRICVLADNGSASASECLLGCMLDYGVIDYEDICLSERNGVAKTFGKGIMQETKLISLQMDAIKLTTARIVWPVSENCIHDRGILPEDGALTVAENYNRDEEARAAVEKLFN